MPILEIIQRLYYEPSYLERTLEKNLEKHGIDLPQPIAGNRFDDIRHGIWRGLEAKDKSLFYQKFYGHEPKFIKKFENDLAKSFVIDERTLLQVLNTNELYSEDIILREGPKEISLIHYPLTSSLNKTTIDLNEEIGIDLFVKIFDEFYKTSLNLKDFKEKLELEEDIEIDIKRMGDFINQLIPHILTLKTEDYIDMIVSYFIK